MNGNDISYDVPFTECLSNYAKIIEQIKQKSIDLIILSVLPRGDQYLSRHPNKSNINAKIESLNQCIEMLCNKKKVIYVNVFKIFIDR